MPSPWPPQSALSLLHCLAFQTVDWLFPPRCLTCERLEGPFCPACRATIVPTVSSPPSGLTGLCVVGQHQAALREAVLRLKFGGKTALASPLGDLLAGELRQQMHAWNPDMLVSVPIHWTRAALRGFNQAELLAEAVGKRSRIPVTRALSRVRATPHQVGLTAAGRRLNVAGAFALDTRHALQGRKVVLVDDVVTSGATMAGCAAILRDAGAEVFGLAVSLGG